MKKKSIFVITFVIISIIVYIAIWLLFKIDGNIPAGSGLDKSDWLGFLGGFLAFAGTIFLGIVALIQTEEANDASDRLLKIEEAQYMPIISISGQGAYDFENERVIMNIVFKNIGKSDISKAYITNDSLCKNEIYYLEINQKETIESCVNLHPAKREIVRGDTYVVWENQTMCIEIENVYGTKYTENIDYRFKAIESSNGKINVVNIYDMMIHVEKQ